MPQRAYLRLVSLSFSLALLGLSVHAAEVAQPELLMRAAWNAKPANINLMRAQSRIKGIIIHHTGERQQPKVSLERKLRGLQSFSTQPAVLGGTKKAKPAWGDMPYHFYIDVSGRIGEGRDVAFAGDTNTGYVTDGFIQVVVEGEFGKETPDPRQLAALDSLVIWLAGRFKVPAAAITGHNDHAKSECPGRNFKPYLTELRTKVTAALK